MASRQASAIHLLSAREVLAASEGEKSDGGGLLLRVHVTSAVFVYRYTAASGRRREMGLGVVRRGSLRQAGECLAAARDRAHEARELVRRGADPIDEREAATKAAEATTRAQSEARERETKTLARVARDYHERVIEPTRSPKHGANWIASLEHHMPAVVWHAPISSITPPVLLTALLAVRSRENPGARIPETLQRMRQRLDAIFEDAIFHGLCTSNPAAAVRRKLREWSPKNKPEQLTALPYRDAPAFMTQLRRAEGVAARCLEFAVLTAARTGEVLSLEWEEVNFEERTWVVPAERMKAGEAHTVFLSERALHVLGQMRNCHARLVFPSMMKDGRPMSNMSMMAVVERMGMRDRSTVHGLCRATFSTWANDTAAARPEVVEACLAHKEQDRVRAAYNRARFIDERRALMDAWANFLTSPVNVVSLRVA